jgi:hypothetical protein
MQAGRETEEKEEFKARSYIGLSLSQRLQED